LLCLHSSGAKARATDELRSKNMQYGRGKVVPNGTGTMTKE